MSVFNIFMLKYMWDLGNLCVAEHLRPQKRARNKDDLAQSMSTGKVVSSRASSRAPSEVTLLPLPHSFILNLAFSFEVRRCCGIKWYNVVLNKWS